MLETYLKQYFNFYMFRPGQKEIVESIMAGKDVVALMPTGGGKSLCYQLPAIMADSASIVISPLIALMKDQVDSLRARGITAAFINSSLAPAENQKNMRDIEEGRCKLVYVAPERLCNAEFRKIFARQELKFVAVDEAHCVSQWGHDFRPDYMQIRDFIQALSKRPAVAAFTATATPEVKNEIIARLGLQNPQIFIRGFDRPNLKFFARAGLRKRDRIREVLRIVKATPGNGIVYAITRNGAEELSAFLNQNNVSAVAYHAGMDGASRTRAQNDFMENRFKVIAATIAFGMGVDKADIRFVIHAGMPASLEEYYQEAGRAGRDGDTAYCILLASNSDFGLHYHFIQKAKQEMRTQGKSWKEIDAATSLRYGRLERMRAYSDEYSCRRKKILDYFSDPAARDYDNKKCNKCDACLNYKWSEIQPERKRPPRRRAPMFDDTRDEAAHDQNMRV